MSEPAPKSADLQALLEKLLQQQADITLRLDGLSNVLLSDLGPQLKAIADQIATVMQVVEEARPLLESGPAKWMATRRQLRKLPDVPPA